MDLGSGLGTVEQWAYGTKEDPGRKVVQRGCDRRGENTPDDSYASSEADCYTSPLDESSSSSASTGKSGMDLGLSLGTGINATIDTDEQKAIKPASDSSSSTSLSKIPSEMRRIHGPAQNWVLNDSALLKHIASFLVGSNSTNLEQMVAAFFLQNGRNDLFNFQRVNKAVCKSLRPTMQKIQTRLYSLSLDEPACRNLLLPMTEQGIYPAVKLIIEKLQRLRVPLATITDANGNNALHLASQRDDIRMRKLILTANQKLDRRQNYANKTPYQQCSTLTRLKLHSRNICLFAATFSVLLNIVLPLAVDYSTRGHPTLHMNELLNLIIVGFYLLAATALQLLLSETSEAAVNTVARNAGLAGLTAGILATFFICACLLIYPNIF
jgi:hypothetical protein